MRVVRSAFKNLHGHITKNLEFATDVNVMIGINGSGKTTLLNAMFWTLSPEAQHGGALAAIHLANLEFDEIRITFTLEGNRRHQIVTAKHNGDTINLSARGVDDELNIPVFSDISVVRPPTMHRNEEANDAISAYLRGQRQNSLLEYLRNLPGPLYLPLDRRWPESEEVPFRRPRRRATGYVVHIPINEVMWYIDRNQRREQISIAQLNDRLRNSLLFSLFQGLGTSSPSGPLRDNILTPQELRNQRERILSTFERLGISDAREVTEGYFGSLEETVQKLQGRDLSNMNPEDPQYSAWVDWVVDGSTIVERIERLVPLIEDYESDLSEITHPSRSFLEAINSFFCDSGKSLSFSENEILTVRLPNGETTDTGNFSSGELQLLTLFAFLYFRFGQQDEFPIIIDEPELSLHLAWQSRYLEAVTEANPRAQFIVATHSPEIAAPFEDRIIDISP